MPSADGYIRINTKIDQSGVKPGLAKLGASLRGFAAAVGFAFGVAAVVRFGKACIETASNLQEVQNVVDVTFGAAAAKINEFAETAAMKFGLSELAAKRYTGTMGAMLKSMGFTEDAAADMSIEMAKLAGDMASFYNLDADEAFAKIRSGISGETEPLKQLGVNLSEANLSAYAMKEGLGAAYSSLSEQNKALVRYNYLMSVTADAQGDFARTSTSWANQIRIVQLQFETLKGTLGQAFIIAGTPVLRVINQIIAGLNNAAAAFLNFINTIRGGTGEATAAVSGTTESVDGLTESTEGTGDAATEAAKKAKGSLASFDKLNTLADNQEGAGGNVAGLTAIADSSAATEAAAAEAEDTVSGFLDRYKTQIAELQNSWQTFKGTVTGVFEELRGQAAQTDIGGTVFGAVLSFADTALASVNLLIGVAGDLMVAFNVPATVQAGLEFLTTVWDTIGAAVKAVTPGIMEFVDRGLVPIATWLGGKVRDAFSFFGEQLEKVGQWFTDHKEDFTELGKTLGDLAGAVWDLIEPIADAAWETAKNIIGGLVDALLAFGDWLFEHQELIGNVAIVLRSFAAGWGLVNGAIAAWGLIAGGAAAATGLFSTAAGILAGVLATVTSPAFLIAAAIGAIIAAVILCIKYWDEIKAKAIEIWDSLKAYFEELWLNIKTGLTEAWTQVSDFFISIWDGLKEKAVTVWDGIKEVWKTVADWFTENVIDPVRTAFDIFKEKIGEIWDNIWGKIKGVINSILGGVETMINAVVAGVNVIIDGLNSIVEMGDTALKAMGFDGLSPITRWEKVSLPRLAEGAVLPPRRPRAVIVGDQTSGTNIESPLSTMKQAFKEALEEMGGAGGNRPFELTVVSKIDAKTVARETIRFTLAELSRIGGSAVQEV